MKFGAGNGAVSVLRTVTAAVTAVPVILLIGLAMNGWTAFWWIGIPLSAGAAVGGWYCPRWQASVHGECCPRHIRIAYGVWLQKEVVVPVSSLRTFEIWAPPLHRIFRCRTVILRFAGGAAVLPLLDRNSAAALTAILERNEE
jgi:membrane protein YdbS with pleckstrin-like domain